MLDHSKRWLSPAQAAEYVGTTERAIRSAIDDGALPFSPIGKRFVLDARALDAWVEGLQKRKSGPAPTGQKSGIAISRPRTVKQSVG